MATKTKTQEFEKLEFNFTPRDEFQDPKFCKKALELREGGSTWAEVAEEMDSTPAIVGLAAKVAQHGRIAFRSHAELVKRVVSERSKGFGWAVIGARAGGLTEGRVQSLYEQGSDEPYFATYVKHGGRPRSDGAGFQGSESLDENKDLLPDYRVPVNGEKSKSTKKAAKKSTKKAATKKATAKKASGKRASKKSLEDMDDEAVVKALDGAKITVKRKSGNEDMTVASVDTVKANSKGVRGVRFQTDEGKTRTVPLAAITIN